LPFKGVRDAGHPVNVRRSMNAQVATATPDPAAGATPVMAQYF
jgi:hypothetical protein